MSCDALINENQYPSDYCCFFDKSSRLIHIKKLSTVRVKLSEVTKEYSQTLRVVWRFEKWRSVDGPQWEINNNNYVAKHLG